MHRNGAIVTLYESEGTCGGHTLTDTTSGYPIDLGFQVFNLTTYPHLEGMFEELGVDSEPSEMSFSLSVDSGKVEWASHGLGTVFAQKKNAVSPSFLKMLYDVLRFGREAPRVLEAANEHIYKDMTLGQYLERHGYSESFKRNYVLPMCAAVWSVPAKSVLEFPICMLIRFWVNHHLLDITNRPCWRVVKGRSRTYVQRILEELPDVRVHSPVVKVERDEKVSRVAVTCETKRGPEVELFDSVVLATHSDISLRMLQSDTKEQEELRDILKKIPYSYNEVYLHQDESLMPKNRDAWASWNCIESREGVDNPLEVPVCVTYWANRLQDLGTGAPDYFVTLNPVHTPAEDKVVRKMVLAHPIFGKESVIAQNMVKKAQGKGGIYLCGAWCGYGFHEDGMRSAINVVESMGGRIPWTPRTCSPKISMIDSIAMKIFDSFAKMAILKGKLRLVLPNGEEMVYGTPEPPAGGDAESWRKRPPLNATVRIYDCAFFRKIISRHDTGLGESYMDGDFEVIEGLSGSGDLGSLMAVITANAGSVEANRGILGIFNRLGDKILTWSHIQRSNTALGSRKNIEEHYDAGNDMYKTFLDETMTYSCGMWKNGETESLRESQLNKIDSLIEKADLQPGHKVLEIGCGWGSFAIRAAQTRQCHIVGLTLSKEQLAEATERVKKAGVDHLVTLLYCDYRDTPNLGTYDRVVSCEMIEAVGHEHLPAYFATIGAALKPGGKAALQVIAAPDERYEAYCNSSDFIREHIFPGGHLPSMGACVEAARGTGLSIHKLLDIGEDYAVTLRRWREAWESKKDEILQLGYSEKFWRKYRFYFVYCEGGFDAKYIHTYQVTWVKDGEFTLSDQDLRRALQMSKGVTPEKKSTGGYSMHPSMATQFLICLYFFLAGMAVAKSPVLWLSPTISFASAGTYLLVSLLSSAFPFYKKMSGLESSMWSIYATHIVYSITTLCFLGMYMFMYPLHGAIDAPSESLATFARSLVAGSAGFFGFLLMVEVNCKLYTKSHWAFAHHTLMLILFSAAAYKDINTHLMCVGLLAEAHSVIHYLFKMLNMAGSRIPGARISKSLEMAIFICCKLLLHFALGVLVICKPSLFPNAASHAIASAGMLYVNGLNIKHAITSPAKLHIE